MKIIIKEKTVEYENSIDQVKLILEKIVDLLDQEKLELSYLLIDGVEVVKDYEAYLTDNIENIDRIEVVTQDLKALIEETLNSALAYLKKAVELLKPLAESFYQSPDQAAWQSLSDLFEGIGWLLDSMNRIDQIRQLDTYISNYDIWNEYVMTIKGLNLQLQELEGAMLDKDQVLIADLLLYEILTIFETGQEKLVFLMPRGGVHVS